jgi:hypothetical protein
MEGDPGPLHGVVNMIVNAITEEKVAKLSQSESEIESTILSVLNESLLDEEVLKGGRLSKEKPEECDEGECTGKLMSATDKGDDPVGDDETLHNDELLLMMVYIEEQDGSAE